MSYKTEQSGEKVAIIAAGDFYGIGERVAEKIEKSLGFKPTLINPRIVSLTDKKTLSDLTKNHDLVLTFEDGVLSGGFGEKVAAYLGETAVKVKNYGLNKEFYDRYNPSELLEKLGITPEAVLSDVKRILNI